MSNLYPKAHSFHKYTTHRHGAWFGRKATLCCSYYWRMLLVRNILQTCSNVNIVGHFYGNAGKQYNPFSDTSFLFFTKNPTAANFFV